MASTAVKVALIGCAVIIVGVIAAVGIGGYFVKRTVSDKYEKVKNIAGSEDSEYGKKTAKLSKQYPFTAPADGQITENQLQRFLAVRRAVYDVYKKHEPEFKKLEGQKDTGFQGLMTLGGVWNEVKLVQANALEQQRMSPEEYSFIVTSVYKSWYAKGTKEALNSQSFREASEKNLKQSIESLDKQIDDPNTPEESKTQLRQTRDQFQKQLDTLPEDESIKRIDDELKSVPQENIALFTKYKDDITKYSMAGLELVGL